MVNIVGRRTVPQVFINGKHLGGSDGKSFLSKKKKLPCPCSHNMIFLEITLNIPSNAHCLLSDFQILLKLTRAGTCINF